MIILATYIPTTMDKQDILLKEYEVAQQHLTAMISHYWQIFSILIPVNTAFFGAVIYAILRSTPNVGVLAVMVGIIGIITMLFLWKYWERVKFYIAADYHRMHEIEAILGMSKNLMVHYLDQYNDRWSELDDSAQKRLDELHKKHISSPRIYIQLVFWAFIAMWVVCIVLSFILPCLKVLLLILRYCFV